jgi:hypothetical protein
MLDRRRENRRRCFLGGKLAFNHRQSLFDCLVRDFGEHGALIDLPDATLLPEEFELHIAHWRRTFHARLVWSENTRNGLALSAFQPEIVSLDEVRRLKALEKENRRLRTLV